MTLSTGTKLSHYEITSQIGKGGMGEVYQATDTKLGRDVAIKVLPEEFAKDSDRVARFQREAKLLASLNHPNIAAIYGLEEAEGTNFLVLELIGGQTLDDRIKASAIPIINVDTSSARPCPYGCSSSGGFLDALKPINTITEDRESDRVCQASAINPTEPVTIPTQYLKANNTPFVIMDIQPTFSDAMLVVFLIIVEMVGKSNLKQKVIVK